MPTALRGPGLVAFLLWAILAPPLAASSPDVVVADCRMTVRAREALMKDDLLRDLNLGVTVHDYVATLWGPVPTQQLSRRAAECVRRVPGVADVVNRLVVEKPGDPLAEFLRTAPPKPPASFTRPPAALTGRADERPLIPQLVWHPANRGESLTEKPGTSAVLMTAIPLPAPASDDEPARAVERLRQGNGRARGLRPEWSGRAVRLRGTVAAWPDLYDFAKSVAAVPGVERVILDGVRLAPNLPR